MFLTRVRIFLCQTLPEVTFPNALSSTFPSYYLLIKELTKTQNINIAPQNFKNGPKGT